MKKKSINPQHTAQMRIDMAQDIMKKAIDITVNTEHDVFVEWAGHVDMIAVDIHRYGWEKNKKAHRLEMGFNAFNVPEAEFKAIMAELDHFLKDAEK